MIEESKYKFDLASSPYPKHNWTVEFKDINSIDEWQERDFNLDPNNPFKSRLIENVITLDDKKGEYKLVSSLDDIIQYYS